MDKWTVARCDPAFGGGIAPADELSGALTGITGNSGRGSFDIGYMGDSRALMVIARDPDGLAVGCGALWPLDENTAEIKRMYAREQGTGIGSAVLAYLEAQAAALKYRIIRLETRTVNEPAVAFYQRHGYRRTGDYGRYMGRPEAVCFEKQLAP